MNLKHHFNVTIDARPSDDTAHVEQCLRERIREIENDLGMRAFEVDYVETFDSESDEEIRTHALVQDAMDDLEKKAAPCPCENDDGTCCEASNGTLMCTLSAGHAGDHIACGDGDSSHRLAAWENKYKE